MLVEEFQATLFSYDEGLQTSDQVLAGAVWRNFFLQENCNMQHVQQLVEYVRHNLHLLDLLSKEDLIAERSQLWTPL